MPATYRGLIRLARSEGFEIKRMTKHGVLYTRGRQTWLVPGSPSDYRSIKNSAADLQRLLKEETHR